MRRTKRGSEFEVRLGPVRNQREVIRDVMFSAGQCATWLTLDELAKLTQYPPSSISAQLRHLRKPQYGGYTVVKRCRAVNAVLRGEGFGPVWEYSVEPVRRVLGKTRRPRARGGSAALRILQQRLDRARRVAGNRRDGVKTSRRIGTATTSGSRAWA